MKIKKVLALLLSLCLVLSAPVAVFAADFADTDGHWAEGAIDRWAGYGIVEGNENAFDPDGNLTRGQLAAIIARLLNLPVSSDQMFGDVDGHWAEDVINSCAAAGIMLGDGINARPDDPVTREETMVLLGRALGIKPVENSNLSNYPDGNTVSDWAEGYVAALTESGIVNGIDGTLSPESDINRASTVTILNKAISAYANEEGQTVEASGSGIVVVAAPNVTVTGEADSVVVAAGASGGTTTFENAKVGEISVTAEESAVVVGENSVAESVSITEAAAGTEVVVEKTAEVNTVTTEAADSKISVSGTVENVDVAETATGTNVAADKEAMIENVVTKAEGTTVSGSGTVNNVTTSGDNTKVDTSGTKVEASEGTTGTTAGGTKVEGGSASTTPSLSGGGSTGGGSSASSDKITTYEKLATAVDAANAGDTVKIGSDIDMAGGIIIEKDLIIDLNGKTLKSTDSMSDIAVIKVSNNANVTIKGNGTINSASNGNDYNIAVWANDGATVTIENGTFKNLGGKDLENNGTTPNNNELIYVSGTGNIIIKDGEFYGNSENKTFGAKFTLNQLDNATGAITVSGGTFYGFNPEEVYTEPDQPKSFVKVGYYVLSSDGNYTVKAADAGNVTSYEELIAAVDAANAGDTIKIGSDINMAGGIIIEKDLIIDLNGKTLESTDSMSDIAVIKVSNNANVTIKGNGTINSASNGNDYNIAVWANDGATVTIENGTFKNLGG
ncbi:MAG: hypothetical protein E7228_05370, partial [Clostridiales bacterium]|nr:hypothetical protein [Clostridiales bacterium]